jgi:hypothetical protein
MVKHQHKRNQGGQTNYRLTNNFERMNLVGIHMNFQGTNYVERDGEISIDMNV